MQEAVTSLTPQKISSRPQKIYPGALIPFQAEHKRMEAGDIFDYLITSDQQFNYFRLFFFPCVYLVF